MEELIKIGQEYSPEELERIARQLKGIAAQHSIRNADIAEAAGYSGRYYISKIFNAGVALNTRNVRAVQDALFSLIEPELQKAA